ncbi:MAG: type II toxin-antitoxin system VapC family toxin [Candidatus Hydrothermarchaeales archaeon]
MIAVDSNIWIYYLDPTLPEHEKVKSALEEVIHSEDILASTIIWMEVTHYLFKVSSLPRADLSQRVKKLLKLSSMTLANFDSDTLSTTIDILEENYRHRIGGRDAAILATMKKNGVSKLMTHDKGFVDVGVEVMDPVG